MPCQPGSSSGHGLSNSGEVDKCDLDASIEGKAHSPDEVRIERMHVTHMKV